MENCPNCGQPAEEGHVCATVAPAEDTATEEATPEMGGGEETPVEGGEEAAE